MTKTPAVDPQLLPHPRPCWCAECKRTYSRLYQRGYVPKRVYVYTKPCDDCGVDVPRKRKRCDACNAVQAQLAAERRLAREKPVTCVCGKPAKRDLCRECYLSAVRKRPQKKICRWCRKEFISAINDRGSLRDRKHAKCCSPECGARYAVRVRMYSGRCRQCNALCETLVCSDCRNKNQRAALHRNRMLRRGAKTAEGYDPFEIAIRDGWICHLCNGSVAPHLRGTKGGDAPTIDHLIPISKGGLDTIDNVKLAHWSCNSRKGNRVEVGHGDTDSRPQREGRALDAQAA